MGELSIEQLKDTKFTEKTQRAQRISVFFGTPRSVRVNILNNLNT